MDNRTVYDAQYRHIKATQPHLVTEKLRERGRDLRSHRLMAAVLHLNLLAEKQSLTGYQDIFEVCLMQSHFERAIILSHIVKLCYANHWPQYTALVRHRDRGTKVLLDSVGEGFYTDLEKLYGNRIEDRKAFLINETKQCHEAKPLSINEITMAVLLYCKRNNLP